MTKKKHKISSFTDTKKKKKKDKKNKRVSLILFFIGGDYFVF